MLKYPLHHLCPLSISSSSFHARSKYCETKEAITVNPMPIDTMYPTRNDRAPATPTKSVTGQKAGMFSHCAAAKLKRTHIQPAPLYKNNPRLLNKALIDSGIFSLPLTWPSTV